MFYAHGAVRHLGWQHPGNSIQQWWLVTLDSQAVPTRHRMHIRGGDCFVDLNCFITFTSSRLIML